MYTCRAIRKLLLNIQHLQEPINSKEKADILHGKACSGQDHQHGDEAGAGYAGRTDTGQSSGQTKGGRREEEQRGKVIRLF